MKKFAEIVDVVGRQVIDSRGNPTVEVDVYDGVGYSPLIPPVELNKIRV